MRTGYFGSATVRIGQGVCQIIATRFESFTETVDLTANPLIHLSTFPARGGPGHQSDTRLGQQGQPSEQGKTLQGAEGPLGAELLVVSKTDVLVNAQAREHPAVLECPSQTTIGDLRRAQPGDRIAVDVDDPGIRCDETRNEIDRGGFP